MRNLTATLCLGALTAAALPALSQTVPAAPGDADALSLADEPVVAPQAAQRWRFFTEAAASRGTLIGAADHVNGARISLDARFDATLAPGWRAVFSDRLDVARHNQDVLDYSVNTLREAYLSWHASPTDIVDFGRVNLRYGSAYGYNPSDFFKVGALRSITSPDPANLRENRQGTIVVQAQKLWNATSVAAAYSPKLGNRGPSSGTFSLNEGATNFSHRWLIAASHKFSENFQPQILFHGGQGLPVQTAFNLSGLIGNATVAYAEVSAGKSRSLVAQSLGLASDPEKMQRRAALGLTYTTRFNLSLTGEVEYNSAAPSRSHWDAYRTAAPGNALRLLQAAQTLQDLPTRRALFVYAAWRDLGLKNLDLNAYVRRDQETRSREQWIEARYHWNKAEVALQWQGYSGDAGSLYGAVPQPRRMELQLRLFL
ncbi:MAG: hypothetical protein ABIX46_09315 [Burkholderiaceae bacterium]